MRRNSPEAALQVLKDVRSRHVEVKSFQLSQAVAACEKAQWPTALQLMLQGGDQVVRNGALAICSKGGRTGPDWMHMHNTYYLLVK